MGKRRTPIVPSQTKLSVQDVPNYGTPDGSSQANEEMRRLRQVIEEMQAEQERLAAAVPRPSDKALSPLPSPLPHIVTNETTIVNNVLNEVMNVLNTYITGWAETVLHTNINGITSIIPEPRVVQSLEFIDRGLRPPHRPGWEFPINWKLKGADCDPALSTIAEASNIKIEAYALAPHQYTNYVINEANEYTDTVLKNLGNKVKVSIDDTLADFLQAKLVEGTNITITKEADTEGVETLRIDAAAMTGDDELAKVTSDDTTAGYLADKVAAGPNIILSVTDDGMGYKTLRIEASPTIETVDEKVKVDIDDEAAGYLEDKLIEGDGITIIKEEDIDGVKTLVIRAGEYKSITCIAGETITEKQVVRSSASGKVFVADATEDDPGSAIGIALESGVTDDHIRVCISGRVTFSGWGLTADKSYMLGKDGALVATPIDEGVWQHIGRSENSTTLLVNIVTPIIL